MRQFLLIFIICFALGVWFQSCLPKHAPCAFCPDFWCQSSVICGDGCFCLKTGSEISGRCASIN